MVLDHIDPLLTKPAHELRDLWQARALTAATGKTAGVLLSVLAHNYDDGMLVLLNVVFPGFTSIIAPFLSSAGRIGKSGQVMADIVQPTGRIDKQAVLYRNEIELRDDFRRLADSLKFTDDERNELFAAVKRWVVADTRIDPTFDPQDPDAKRLH